MHEFDLSGRSEKDAIIAMQIDEPVGGSFAYRTLQTPGFAGTAGDGLLSIVGISGVDVPVEGENTVELFLVNHRPSVDTETRAVSKDQSTTGGNATIEHFAIRGSRAEEMMYLQTWADDAIATPNRPAAAGNGGFYVTNSHGRYKTGVASQLGALLGTGDVAFCSPGKGCRRVSSGHKGPNGMARREGLVYVPNMLRGNVQVFNITEDGGLQEVEDIHVGYAIDNLSVDAKGDVYAAAFPAMADMRRAFGDPLNARPSATALRIRKGEDGMHTWEKALEDGDGGVFAGATTVVHDAKTGRLFLSGKLSQGPAESRDSDVGRCYLTVHHSVRASFSMKRAKSTWEGDG